MVRIAVMREKYGYISVPQHLQADEKCLYFLITYGQELGYLSGTALGYGLDDRGFESR
jgi:hypothetical protein